MRAAVVLVACFAVAGAETRLAFIPPDAVPAAQDSGSAGRLIGGSAAAITQYPFSAALLFSYGTVFSQACGGSIITTRAILSAAHCFVGDSAIRWRVRVGSEWASFGGAVHVLSLILVHPSYDAATRDSDLAMLHASPFLELVPAVVQPVVVAGENYNLLDNQLVWTSGWASITVSYEATKEIYTKKWAIAFTCENGGYSEQLRQVELRTVNQETCRVRMRFSTLARNVTENMLCSGWLDVGGRGQCSGGAGSPLLHNGVLVGVHSWGVGCGLARYPDVNTRVSRFIQWIVTNA